MGTVSCLWTTTDVRSRHGLASAVMKRTVSVVAATSGAAADVRLDASRTLAEVLPGLARLTGSDPRRVTRDGVVLDPGLPVAGLRDGDALVLADEDSAPAPVLPGAARIEVTAGPDAGLSAALPAGRWVLGRAIPGHAVPGRAEQPLPLTDPQLSREHVEVVVGVDGRLVVTDLRSTNGSRLGDIPLTAGRPVQWPAGTVLRCGGTRLVHGRTAVSAATTVAADGTTLVNRPPRLDGADRPRSVVFPTAPTPTSAGRLPLLASIAPLLAGVVLAMLMHRWEFLAFAVMSPLVVLGQALTDRLAARRANRAAAREHATATALAEQQLAEAAAADAQARHDRAPDLAALAGAAVERTSLLWHRGRNDADALTLRVGLGSLPAQIRVEGERAIPTLHDVPVCVDLTAAHVVGVCGEEADALARSLLVQAATLLGPADLSVHVLTPTGARRWAWVRWLPHAVLATTSAQVRAHADGLTRPAESQLRLVLVDGVDADVVSALAAQDGNVVVCLGDSAQSLPSACAAVVTLTGSQAILSQGGEETHVAADLLSPVVAERVARALCPLRDGRTTATSLPRSVAWSSLHDVALGTAEAAAALLRRWRGGPSTTVCLGLCADGPYVIDLQADGPHLLVAGTTGAGKSELLQTLVASLVTGSSPADLNLLLVDFKGGAAFGPCETLPHTVGVLTDLDASTTTRAIESLSAELRRRERVLSSAGAPDLDSWRARELRGGEGCEHMPRLVIVVDEFATLAEELPEFVGGLVGIAQRGRSLGVHLVLATQRPEGAVSSDIRANTRLRICLAVAREAESRDVLDSPRAVGISRRTPGRALVRVGAHELVEVQTARVAGAAAPRAGTDPTAGVELLPLSAWGEESEQVEAGGGLTELDLLVAAATEAAEMSGLRAASPPWLPPLPADVVLSRLPAGTTRCVPIGVVDQPHTQSQPPLTVDPEDAEPLLVVGGGRSGRTNAVVTVATALAAALGPDQLHVYAIAHGNGAAALSALPHTGAVIDVREVERVEQLLAFLAVEVERRSSCSDGRTPRLLLVVDGWDSFVAATAEVDGGRCQDMVLRLLAHGPAAGLRVVLSSDRSGLSGRLSSAVRHRICLRLPDSADYALLGLPARRVPTSMPPGRGIRAEDGAVVQLALVDEETRRRARSWPAPVTPPRRFEPLPARVPLHTLGPTTGRLIVGVGGDGGSPVVLDPHETGGSFLVAGPPRSGRSTTLVSLAAQLHARSPVALCSRPGPLRQRRDLAAVADAADPVQSREALASLAPDGALLVDDIDLVDDPGLLDSIEAAMRRLRDGGGLVVLAGTTDAMAASFRGPVAAARRSRTGLLLRPEGVHDGELLGVRLRRRPANADPPGRGVLALHGRAVPLQVPDPS